MTDVAGRRALVLGLAREGASLARFLADHGAHVTVTDSAPEDRLRERVNSLRGLPIRFVLGGEHPELVDEVDDIFVSPGVPEDNPTYAAARATGLPIQSMTTLFFDRCPGRILGITGSSGKTTTTGLIGHMLRTAGIDSVVGGNIGDPMLDLLPAIAPTTLVVLELSSFQLDLLRRSPAIAVVTNISPNHLDRHGTMERYIAAKRHIVQHQSPSDVAVLNDDDPIVRSFADSTNAAIHRFGRREITGYGATIRDGRVVAVVDGTCEPVLPVWEIPLLGEHNVEDVLAAVTAAQAAGAPVEAAAEAIRTFQPAPHRLQLVGRIDGVSYIDDSIATSPARAIVALRAIDAPVVLIAGGRDKHLPWDDFAALATRRARALVLIGEAAPLIEASVRRALREESSASLRSVVRCSSLEEAVERARALARPGDVVLLSPGCTSYDMFENFEERGAVFARAVEAVRAA